MHHQLSAIEPSIETLSRAHKRTVRGAPKAHSDTHSERPQRSPSERVHHHAVETPCVETQWVSLHSMQDTLVFTPTDKASGGPPLLLPAAAQCRAALAAAAPPARLCHGLALLWELGSCDVGELPRCVVVRGV